MMVMHSRRKQHKQNEMKIIDVIILLIGAFALAMVLYVIFDLLWRITG